MILPDRLCDRSLLRGAGTFLLVSVLVVSCKDGPTPPINTIISNSWTPTNTELTFKTETQDGHLSPIVLLASEIIWAPDSGILSAKVALHNTGPDTLVGPMSVEVFDFSPQGVVPLNAVCGIVVGPCWYEYNGRYGGDGMLSPGETSSPRQWQIHNPRGEGFRFRSRLVPNPPTGGRIGGVVFEDHNKDGKRDANELGIAGVLILMKSNSGEWRTLTNRRGYFEIPVRDPGVYTVNASGLPRDTVPTTPVEMNVVVFRDANGNLSNFLEANFGRSSDRPGFPGIAGRVFLDSDRNGIQDPNETGIVTTITVRAFASNMPPIDSCFVSTRTIETDAEGRYFIAHDKLPCGPPWLVQRGPKDIGAPNPDNLFGTTPRDYLVHGFQVPAGNVEVNFGMAPYDSSQEAVLVVEGLLFIDFNANGLRDAEDVPALGAHLNLLSPCDRLESTWTNANGYYRFEPPNTDWCEIGGVALGGSPDDATTTNPVLFPPVVEPGIHTIRADFGVRPHRMPQ